LKELRQANRSNFWKLYRLRQEPGGSVK